MVVELSQVLKLLDVVKSHQSNGKSKRQEVKKDFELRKIDKGLEYPICLSSIYTKRKFKPPKRAIKKFKIQKLINQ